MLHWSIVTHAWAWWKSSLTVKKVPAHHARRGRNAGTFLNESCFTAFDKVYFIHHEPYGNAADPKAHRFVREYLHGSCKTEKKT